MRKRIFDISCSGIGLLLCSPLLLILAILIWLTDFGSPLYVSMRIGRDGKPFQLLKFRSMKVNADTSGASSTAADDKRITAIGHIIRRYKLDELPQLWNVFVGEMSLVGPRPNLGWAVEGYTVEERELITVRPGITDFSSIVFSDEGEILAGSNDPDYDYDRLIRPWKSQLGLIYVRYASLFLDLKIIAFTIISLFSRERALLAICKELKKFEVSEEILSVASRRVPLEDTIKLVKAVL